MKLKHYGAALIPLCLAIFLFRAVEVILAVDPSTGYYTVGSVLPTVFHCFLFAAACFLLSLMFVVRRESRSPAVRLYRASLFDLITGIAASVCIVAASLFRSLDEVFNGAGIQKFWTRPSFYETLLALASAVFLIFFITYPRKSAKQNVWRLLSLAPVFWYLLRLVEQFQDLDTVFSKVYGIWQITLLGLIAAALMNFTKLLCGLSCRKSFVFFTFCSALILSLKVADLVLRLLPGNPYEIQIEMLPLAADLLITILLLSQCRKLIKGKRRQKEDSQK